MSWLSSERRSLGTPLLIDISNNYVNREVMKGLQRWRKNIVNSVLHINERIPSDPHLINVRQNQCLLRPVGRQFKGVLMFYYGISMLVLLWFQQIQPLWNLISV